MDGGDRDSEVAALRTEIAALAAQFEQVQRGTHEFVAMLAHELRTPLGAILMWAHVLRMGREENRDTALDAIEESARTQSRLIGNLLDVFRAMAGRLRIERKVVDLAALVQQVVAERGASSQETAVTLNLSIQSPSLYVRGDALRLRDVIATLVKHAVSASPPGGMVKIDATQTGKTVRIAVHDKGPDLPAAQYAQLFMAFRLAGEPEGRLPGSLGLELPLARAVAELHGGTVTAYSRGVGEGSTFVLDLPADEPS